MFKVNAYTVIVLKPHFAQHNSFCSLFYNIVDYLQQVKLICCCIIRSDV